MIIYVLDIIGIQPDADLLEDNSIKAELIWLHRDIFIGCTDSLSCIKTYYNQLNELIGQYVKMEVYEYDVKTSYDDHPDDIDDKVLSTVALTMFNEDPDTGHELHAMSRLIDLPDDTNGEVFIISDSLNEIYVDTVLGYGSPELDILDTLAVLFTLLDNYIIDLTENDDLIALRNALLCIIPTLPYDFYDITARFSMNPVYMEKLWFMQFGFLD